MNKLISLAFATISALALFTACGDTESSSYDCCLNGAYYDCATESEFGTCNLEDGATECSRDSSKDSECE